MGCIVKWKVDSVPLVTISIWILLGRNYVFAILVVVHTWSSFKKYCFIMITELWLISGTGAPIVHLMPWAWFAYCIFAPVINVSVTHIAGVCNDIADSLSRFQTSSGNWFPGPKYCLTAYLHGLHRSTRPPSAMLVL